MVNFLLDIFVTAWLVLIYAVLPKTRTLIPEENQSNQFYCL